MTTTMTITAPTETNEVKFFNVEFEKENFNEVVEHVELIVKESDVYLLEEMGIYKIK